MAEISGPGAATGVDRALASELEARMHDAAQTAHDHEAEAMRQRNAEAGCRAALETLVQGFDAQGVAESAPMPPQVSPLRAEGAGVPG